MVKSIKFSHYRNLDGKRFEFDQKLNVIVGENNSGKTNLLEGIKLAFSSITDDYVKVGKGDFENSDDSIPICIEVELEKDSIPSLNYFDEDENIRCGFKMTVFKTQGNRYRRTVELLNGGNIDFDILRDDEKVPNICTIPFVRTEDIYADGMIVNLSNFVDSEEKYKDLRQDYKETAESSIENKKERFQEFCRKFNQNLDIELSDPVMTDEKVYIVEEGGKEHNYKIGAGYKSIANILLNAIDDKYSIVLIDEIENHLHPALVRTLIREIRSMDNIIFIGTTHSPVVVNALKMEELHDISQVRFSSLSKENRLKLNTFLHPGRGELILAENVILVEGFSEELLLNAYIDRYNYNWTIVNVEGVMFEPYIELANLLKKKIIVISDNDKANTDSLKPSARFNHLREICDQYHIKLIEVDNTLESDLYESGYLDDYQDLLKEHEKHKGIYIAKSNKKIEIAEEMINNEIDLSAWHVIEEIINEFSCD